MSTKFYLVGYSGQNLTGHTSKPSFDSEAEAKEYQRKYKHVSTIARAKIVKGTSDKMGFITPVKESAAVIGFKEFMDLVEGVFDPTAKRTALSTRSSKEQSAIDAHKKQVRDAANNRKVKLVVHIQFEDGTIKKHQLKFDIFTNDPDAREKKIQQAADDVLKNMKYIAEKFPKSYTSKPKSVYKIEVK